MRFGGMVARRVLPNRRRPAMSFVDVGTTRRLHLTPSRRLKIWQATAGCCVLCERASNHAKGGSRSTVRALELGAAGDLACAGSRTRQDHAQAVKAKRRKVRH